MKQTRSWRNLWRTKMLGLLLLVSVWLPSCATPVVSNLPYQCPPLTEAILDDYEVLQRAGLSTKLRAWVRETDRVCRANAALLPKE